MEVNDVLIQFTKLCNTQHVLLQHHLASNSTLEWYGRTIRGRTRVYPYYRFDLCQQYEHCFEKALPCLPIEYKSSHELSKILTKTDIVYPAQSVVEDLKALTDEPLTPLQRITTPFLPKIDRGNIFITTPDLSPVFNQEITPPSYTENQSSETNEPPAKRFRFIDEKPDPAGDRAGEASSELLKSKYFKGQICDTDISKTNEIGQGDCVSSSEDDDKSTKTIQSDTGYTDLLYLESIGTVRKHNLLKHRGITNLSQTVDGLSPISNSNIDLTNAPNERKTKLKISYRIRRHDNLLQFALIIYEDLARNPSSRRNLLNEFEITCDKNDSISAKKNIEIQKSMLTKSAEKKSLKRRLKLE